jgi:flagellar biosynthetic protein FliQ
MDSDTIINIGREALYISVTVVGPVLLVGLLVGLVVGMFQAATQIQEMTLTFIPKLIGMAITLGIIGTWMIERLVGYTRALYEQIPFLIG